jgi:hypothetical protein
MHRKGCSGDATRLSGAIRVNMDAAGGAGLPEHLPFFPYRRSQRLAGAAEERRHNVFIGVHAKRCSLNTLRPAYRECAS